MGEMKPWHLIVIAAAVLALGYSGWSFMNNQGIDQVDGIMAVDIRTGQLYDVKKGSARGMAFPMTHPETGERTIFPVEQSESGSWMLIERYSDNIDEDLLVGSAVFGSGLDVDTLDSGPVRLVVKP